jgi:dinuclear metal center YbgI/SA1388 family protein
MPKASLSAIVRYCDTELRTDEIQDYDRACNGLQVDNRGTVTRIAAAVDASLTTIKMAVDAGANLLIAHHGLFWSPTHPWTGKRYELIKFLVENDCAVYSSHLPLDAHPKLGNNALLFSKLRLKKPSRFFFERGGYLGIKASHRVSRSHLANRLRKATGTEPLMIPAGPNMCSRIGIVTGGAGSELKKAAAEGVDTFITGEGPHWTYSLAEELGINVLYGGHYATETFGVKALAGELSRRFKVPWIFVDHPTGL